MYRHDAGATYCWYSSSAVKAAASSSGKPSLPTSASRYSSSSSRSTSFAMHDSWLRLKTISCTKSAITQPLVYLSRTHEAPQP